MVKNRANQSEWFTLKNGKLWQKLKDYLVVVNGVLMISIGMIKRVVVPEHVIGYILRVYHGYDLSGHRSFDKTFHAIQEKFFWIGMRVDIKNFCDSCDVCQRFKSQSHNHIDPLKQIVVNRPWQLIGIDFMGPFCTKKRGNLYIVLAIDYFSKLIEGMALESFSAEDTAKFIFE